MHSQCAQHQIAALFPAASVHGVCARGAALRYHVTQVSAELSRLLYTCAYLVAPQRIVMCTSTLLMVVVVL